MYLILYLIIYYSLATFALGTGLIRDLKLNNKDGRLLLALLLGVIGLAYIFLFGLRGPNIGADTKTYLMIFDATTPTYSKGDYLNTNIILLIKSFTNNGQVYLFCISIIFISVLLKGIYEFSKGVAVSAFLFFFSIISMFSFQSFGINIIRQGVAVSFLILALGYWVNKKSAIKITISLALAVGFHLSALLPIFIFFTLKFIPILKNITISLVVYFLFAFLSALNISFLTFASLLPSIGPYADYIAKPDPRYSVGFKPQFILFNTIFLLLFLLIYNYAKKLEIGKYFKSFLSQYCYTSAFFFMCFQIPYSDRVGIYSWLLVPVLLSPIFSMNFPIKCSSFIVIFLIFIFTFFSFI